MPTSNLKPMIEREGQRYVDNPVYQVMKPRWELVTPLAGALAEAFGSKLPSPIVEIVGHERTRLRWMKPDGKGGLVPR